MRTTLLRSLPNGELAFCGSLLVGLVSPPHHCHAVTQARRQHRAEAAYTTKHATLRQHDKQCIASGREQCTCCLTWKCTMSPSITVSWSGMKSYSTDGYTCTAMDSKRRDEVSNSSAVAVPHSWYMAARECAVSADLYFLAFPLR